MTLIATGDNLRNKAMLGLQAMSQEEAEREAIRQQMLQAEKAQRAQLAGTALGIGGAYVQREYGGAIADRISGLFSSPQAPATPLTPAEQSQLSQGLGSPITQQSTSQALAASGNPAAVTQVADLLGQSSAITGSPLVSQAPAQVLGQGLNAAAGVSPTIASAATPAAGAVPSITLGGTTTTLSGAAGVSPAIASAAGGAGAGTGTAAAATATPAAGTAPMLAQIAPPLAIGLGAFFLLNQLFDF